MSRYQCDYVDQNAAAVATAAAAELVSIHNKL
jgi:hypothetical protein